jgi:hypothetical protein
MNHRPVTLSIRLTPFRRTRYGLGASLAITSIMQVLASRYVRRIATAYFAPLGLSNIVGRPRPRPALRLAWADIGCPFGALGRRCAITWIMLSRLGIKILPHDV